jgi:UDP-N-acetylmuramoyl-tripeptide--D-alanyl-D-alanine ligase
MFRLDELLVLYGEAGPVLKHAQSVVFSGVTTDSRECLQDGLFVALAGERFDGHSFVQDALKTGCRGALVRSDQLTSLGDIPAYLYQWRENHWVVTEGERGSGVLVAVPDTLEGLQRLAASWRSRFPAVVVVGITGSVGKSSTKELAASVLEQSLLTLKSPKSFNNEIGLPLTLLQLRPKHQVVVLEMGTYGPGEITLLTEIAHPHIGVVTNVSHSHLERMGKLETIARAKSELPAALPPDGLAVFNGDESLIRDMASVVKAPIRYYGLSADCDYRAGDVRSHGLEGISFTVRAGGEVHRLRCSLLGWRSVYNALAVIVVARYLEMDWDVIAAGLRDPAARLRLLPFPGFGGSTLIDDTYNASPVSCRAALDLLKELPGTKIAVFGDMLELGAFEEKGHRQVGGWAAEVVHELIVLGTRARWIGEQALIQGMPPSRVHAASDHQAIIDLLKDRLGQDDVVLVKGSRGMEMDRVVNALKREE